MIRHYVQIACDICETPYNPEPLLDDPVSEEPDRVLLKAAEADGWLIQRLVRDISYGAALCTYCRGISRQ